MAKQVPSYTGTLRNHSLTIPACVSECSGIRIFGRRIKSLAFSTDVAIIKNINADAIIAVYPFTPQPVISQAIISVSDEHGHSRYLAFVCIVWVADWRFPWSAPPFCSKTLCAFGASGTSAKAVRMKFLRIVSGCPKGRGNGAFQFFAVLLHSKKSLPEIRQGQLHTMGVFVQALASRGVATALSGALLSTRPVDQLVVSPQLCGSSLWMIPNPRGSLTYRFAAIITARADVCQPPRHRKIFRRGLTASSGAGP